jgi:hypothetical protein
MIGFLFVLFLLIGSYLVTSTIFLNVNRFTVSPDIFSSGETVKMEENYEMGKEFSQEHIMKICLAPELYMAMTAYQVQKGIGKSYAGLLLLTKALYQEKLISKENYEKFVYRYSRKLVPEEQPTKLTFEQQKNKQKLDEKARSFGAVYSQWDTHPNSEWRQRWINEARKYQDSMPEANEFLRKVNKES